MTLATTASWWVMSPLLKRMYSFAISTILGRVGFVFSLTMQVLFKNVLPFVVDLAELPKSRAVHSDFRPDMSRRATPLPHGGGRFLVPLASHSQVRQLSLGLGQALPSAAGW